MLVLIAESKTMNSREREIPPEEYSLHKPVFEKEAGEIIENLDSFSPEELASEIGISKSYVVKLKSMIYEFKNKRIGNSAIESYTGVVFKALDYESLSNTSKERCEESVRIISSLYGWLAPEDIIKPYRLDFTNKVSPDATPLNTFWKRYVTIQLVRLVKDKHHQELINLLPSDASKCIDWKLLKNFCKVWKVDFQEFTDGGEMRTPAANKLKRMRGYLLRQILEEDIRDVSTLMRLISDKFVCEGTPVYPDHLQFIC